MIRGQMDSVVEINTLKLKTPMRLMQMHISRLQRRSEGLPNCCGRSGAHCHAKICALSTVLG